MNDPRPSGVFCSAPEMYGENIHRGFPVPPESAGEPPWADVGRPPT